MRGCLSAARCRSSSWPVWRLHLRFQRRGPGAWSLEHRVGTEVGTWGLEPARQEEGVAGFQCIKQSGKIEICESSRDRLGVLRSGYCCQVCNTSGREVGRTFSHRVAAGES